jgi:hypothetical protein
MQPAAKKCQQTAVMLSSTYTRRYVQHRDDGAGQAVDVGSRFSASVRSGTRPRGFEGVLETVAGTPVVGANAWRRVADATAPVDDDRWCWPSVSSDRRRRAGREDSTESRGHRGHHTSLPPSAVTRGRDTTIVRAFTPARSRNNTDCFSSSRICRSTSTAPSARCVHVYRPKRSSQCSHASEYRRNPCLPCFLPHTQEWIE